MFENIKKVHYKQLFLYGFYISYIGLTSFAALVDFLIDNPTHAIIDLGSVIIAILSFMHYRRTGNEAIASIMLFWIASCVIFIFVLHSHFGMSIIYTLLIPIVAFILLSRQDIIRHVTGYFIILGLVFLYGYISYENHPLLYNIQPMSTYLIALLFVMAFGIFYHIAIEQHYRELEYANRQNTFLVKEIHHRVKNNLNIIASILGLQKLKNNSPELQRIIDQNRLRLESIALAHEILYKHDDLEHIDFKTYMGKLCSHIMNSENNNPNISVEIHAIPIELSIENMIQFGIIINELMTNSLKYAFVGKESGIITISLQKLNERYVFTYHDDGIGLDELKHQDGFGQSLIQMSTEHLHGKLKIKNHVGLTYRFTFKELF